MNRIIYGGTKCYRVNRSEVYVGKVINNTSGTQEEYRSILFALNNEDLAQDLLFNSPNYPIIGITKGEIDSPFVIDSIYSMKEILEFFGFNFLLYLPDVLSIKNLFFNKSFIFKNLGLFGVDEEEARNSIYYEEGMSAEDLLLKICHLSRTMKANGCEQPLADLIKRGCLPLEFIDVIYRICEISEISKNNKTVFKKIDSFTPPKIEGPIKKLK